MTFPTPKTMAIHFSAKSSTLDMASVRQITWCHNNAEAVARSRHPSLLSDLDQPIAEV
jgi:hypothetical protein